MSSTCCRKRFQRSGKFSESQSIWGLCTLVKPILDGWSRFWHHVKYLFNLIPFWVTTLKMAALSNMPRKRGSHNYPARQMVSIHYTSFTPMKRYFQVFYGHIVISGGRFDVTRPSIYQYNFTASLAYRYIGTDGRTELPDWLTQVDSFLLHII